MTIVYVLVSTSKDTYYEQAVISLISLKKHNPNANVFFIVDQDTEKTLTGKRTLHEKYGAKVLRIDVPEKYANMERSRYLKTTMYQHIDDDFLYIDGDTVICDKLDDLFCMKNIDIGMVPDGHRPIDEWTFRNGPGNSCTAARKKGWCKNLPNGFYFNGGMMYVRKTEKAKQFFDLWHSLWNEEKKLLKLKVDQPPLNEANCRLGCISKIPFGYNCQITRCWDCMQYIHDAKILHYFSSGATSPYDLTPKSLHRTILEENHPEVDRIIENPKSAFTHIVDVCDDVPTAILTKSYSFRLLRFVFVKIKPLFLFVETLLKIISYIPRKIKRYLKMK